MSAASDQISQWLFTPQEFMCPREKGAEKAGTHASDGRRSLVNCLTATPPSLSQSSVAAVTKLLLLTENRVVVRERGEGTQPVCLL